MSGVRLWFVIPNDIKGDGRMWSGTTPPNAIPAPIRRPARGEGPANLNFDDNINEVGGYGMYLTTKESKEILAFSTKEKAQEYAKYQAGLNPQKLYGIFTCEQVYETTTPEILEKRFNDVGELVLATTGS